MLFSKVKNALAHPAGTNNENLFFSDKIFNDKSMAKKYLNMIKKIR